MRNADAASAGVADEGYNHGFDTTVADPVTGSAIAERDHVMAAGAVDSTASGTPVGTTVEPDGMSSHAHSVRRKSNTAVEQIETSWKHAAIRPVPHAEPSERLLEETDKVTHRNYSTGFYYPEHKVTQNTDRPAYFYSWLVVDEVLSQNADEDGRVTLINRNKIEPGQQVESLLSDERPSVLIVSEAGLRDADGASIPTTNDPAYVFSMSCPYQVPINAATRSYTKKPTPKAE